MRLPRIEIYINDKSGISVAHVKVDGETLIFDFSLDQLLVEGEGNAALTLGESALTVLKLWHPNILKDVAAPAPISRAEIKESLSQELIGLSISERTDKYIDTIDNLLSESSIELGADFLVNSWPVIRKRIIELKVSGSDSKI
ncbi:hypothetical protein [Massilia aquatica]|uniref:Uncharacterized protein n=1 Tax=Massilia aquatica TaxID=2609000 RepID=A0ABX0M663_9BURK|nr:hypothetical protein [Massilia aquatica]NHZ42673.1 hypothetical protein [Massilia aquatica]